MKTLTEISTILNVELPTKYSLKDLKISSLDDILKFVEESSKNKIFGEYPEGWVLYKNGVVAAKFKNSTYIALHHLGGGSDSTHQRNVILEAFFAGAIDDILKVLSNPMLEFVEKLRLWWINKKEFIVNSISEISKGVYPDQKSYALAVQKIVTDKSCHSFFFSNKEVILSDQSINDQLNKWVKEKWVAWEKEIKAI